MEQKVRGLLSYLFGWLGGLIVLLAFKDNTKETNKNACQSITLSIVYLAITIVVAIINAIITIIITAAGNDAVSVIFGIFAFIIGLVRFAISIFFIVFVIIGMVKSYQEKDVNIPVITGLTQKIFKSKLA